MPIPTSGAPLGRQPGKPHNPFYQDEEYATNSNVAPTLPPTPETAAPSYQAPESSRVPFSWDLEEEDLAPVAPPALQQTVATPPPLPNAPMPVQHAVQEVAPVAPEPTYSHNEEPEEILEEDSLAMLQNAYESYPPEIQESIDSLLALFSNDKVSEIIMNGPATIMYKSGGERIHESSINFGTVEIYHNVINQFLLTYTSTNDRIGTAEFLIEGQLELFDEDDAPPVLARVHIVAPPAKEIATVTIAKKSRVSYTVDDIVNTGAMTPSMGEFIKALTRARVTMVISGVSGSGKTTLLEAMSQEFDPNDHVIVVEDTPELRIPSPSTVYLHARSPRPGADKSDGVSMEWLVRATNRMRPDRIVVGEIRGGEMADFLIAANSGADGSITTLHAATPRMALDKMLSLVMKSPDAGTRSETIVNRDIASIVGIVVQTSLIDGKHVITDIEEISNTVSDKTGQISTQPIFTYDRNTRRHYAATNPTSNLRAYMESRGVAIDQAWFQR